MNIKITYHWLREHLETNATAAELQKYLSLCGPSVERIEKIGEESVLDIEVTSNRVDTASVRGIAREASAILPQFDKKATLIPLKKSTPVSAKNPLPLTIQDPHHLCHRILGVVMDVDNSAPTPHHIKTRLELCGIRSLSPLIDVTNYVMLELGHPTHVFDYDRIKTNTLLVRKAKKGETVTTLDEKKHRLTEEDIVIDDGTGRIIDLPGIMGTANSVVTTDTKRILFFIDNIDAHTIRKTSMRLAIRTDAATINDKGPDPELAYTAFEQGINLFSGIARGKIVSHIVDIYPHKRKEKNIHTYLTDIQRVMGIPIDENTVVRILQRLDFGVTLIEEEEMAYPDNITFQITVPSYRVTDVQNKEDIAEEVARVYGYSNLPSEISPMVYIKQPQEIEQLFSTQRKMKYHLKSIGFHEVLSYSLVSKKLLIDTGADPAQHIRLTNTISTDIEYLRQSLLASLINIGKKNQGKQELLRFFEIAKIYLPKDGDLPTEKYHLALTTNTSMDDIKGAFESLMRYFHVSDYRMEFSSHSLFLPGVQMSIFDKKSGAYLGVIGQLNETVKNTMNLKTETFLLELDFEALMKLVHIVSPYHKPEQYAIVKLDATIPAHNQTFQDMREKAHKASSLLLSADFLSRYEQNITLRFYFTSTTENITEETAKHELKRIIQALR